MTLLCSQMTGDSNDLLGKDAASQRGKQDPCAPATSSPHRTHSGFRNINLFFWFSCLLFPLSSYCFLCASPSLVCQQNLYSPFRTQLRHRLPQEPSLCFLSTLSQVIHLQLPRDHGLHCCFYHHFHACCAHETMNFLRLRTILHLFLHLHSQRWTSCLAHGR